MNTTSLPNLTPTADCAATSPLATGANTYAYLNGTNGVGATLTAGQVNTALVVDGVTVVVGTIVLVMGEGLLSTPAPQNNGLYICTTLQSSTVALQLTRHPNMNIFSQFSNIPVMVGSSGTANKNTLWMFQNVSGTFTVGTSAVVFASLGVLGSNKNVQQIIPSIGGSYNTVAWDVSKGLNAYVQLSASNSGNNVLTISNLPASASNIGVYGTLVVQQPATESTPPAALALPSGYTNRVVGGGGGAVLLSTIANYYDIITFYYDGLSSPTLWWTYAPNFN